MKHATPYPWCICVESRDFSLTRSRTRILDLQGRELHGRRFESTPSPSPPKRQIASLQQDGMSKFTVRCSDAVALARTNFSCVHVSNLGAAHMILSAFIACGTSASVSLDGRLRIYFGKIANPMALRLSGMCVCHHDTPVHTEDTTSLRPSTALETTSPSCREDRFRHPCRDHMDECAFERSAVVRRDVSVSMCSFCFLPTNSLKHPYN